MKKLLFLFVIIVAMFSCTKDGNISQLNKNAGILQPTFRDVDPMTVIPYDSIPTGLVTTKTNRSTTTITISTGTISRGTGIPVPPWRLFGKAVLITQSPATPYYPANGTSVLQYTSNWVNYDLGTAGFSVTLTVDNIYLFQNILYNIRTMAVQSSGPVPPRNEYVGYGEVESFYFNKPYMIGMNMTNVSGTTATVHSFFDDQGASAITAIGFCWGTASSPTISGPHSSCTILAGDDWDFTSNLTGLTQGTIYYVRPYATNSQGTFYGSQVTFTTIICPTFALTGGLITVNPTSIESLPTNVNATVNNYQSGTTITRATAVKYHVTGTITGSNWNGTNPCWSNLNLSLSPAGYVGAYFTQQMTITKAGCPSDIKTAKVLVIP